MSITPVTGTVTSSTNTGIMLDFEPLIQLLDPFDVPLQASIGTGGESALSSTGCFEIQVDWLDETTLTPRANLGALVATADGFVTISAASGGRIKFQTDDVVLVNNEYLRVTGYGTTAESLTVVRAFAGSTAAQQANNSVVVGVGQAAVEGSDPAASRMVDRNRRFNYTQIFQAQVQVSGTSNAIRKYGLTGTEFDHQAGRRMSEKAVEFEQALLYGARFIDTTNSRRTMGGMANFITTNVNSTSTSLTESVLLDSLQATFDAGGSPNRIVCGARQKRVISAFTTFGTLQVMRPDTQRGVVVNTYISDFGECLVVLDRWCRVSDLFIFNRDQAEIAVLRGMQMMPLAKTGDSERAMILHEKSLRFYRERHASRFSALT